MAPPDDIVAWATFLAAHVDGSESRVVVEVGRPYEVSEHEWACPVSVTGLLGPTPDVRGESALQALALAIGFAYSMLATFLRKGGRLFDPGGGEWSLDELAALFGRTR